SDALVAAERHVELALLIEAAEPVVAGPVQVIEERGGLEAMPLSRSEQVVEPIAALVEKRAIVLQRQPDPQALLQPAIERDKVRVRVVEQRPVRQQPERDGQAAAKRLDEPAMRMWRP